MTDIFLSYARSTRPTATLIQDALAALGYSVWRDEALPVHKPYPNVIQEQLDQAQAVVVLWSRDAVDSDWVRAEADFARNAQKLVQVTLDGTLPPIPFNQIHCAPLSHWQGDLNDSGWQTLVTSLATLTRPASASASSQHRPRTAPLIAVLPFDNLSADDELVYFSDGVSEEIMQTVSRATGLRVVGRSSSFQFRGRDKGIRQVAAALDCSHVLDGAVRRSGNRIRISAQLIECDSQTTLWSDRFDRELADVFELQDEIASAVAQAMQVTFAHRLTAASVDPIAYDLYLKAKASRTQWLGANDAALLEQAIARAPAFAEAWAALAVTRAIDFHLERDEAALLTARIRAIEAANAALGLDPAMGAAYAALSIVEPVCGRFIERQALIEKALSISPNDPVVLFWASRWSWGVGRLRDDLGYMTRAYAIDPLWPQGVHEYAAALWITGFETEAVRIWDEAMARWPDLDYLFGAQLYFAAVRSRWDRFDVVRVAAERNAIDTPGYRQVLRICDEMRQWRPQHTERRARSLTNEFDRTGALSLIQQFTCRVGLTDLVYDLFERASFDHLFQPGGRLVELDAGLHHLFSPTDHMRRDRRFVKLCAHLGLCDYWVKTERWPDCADELAPYYDFRAEARRYVAQGS